MRRLLDSPIVSIGLAIVAAAVAIATVIRLTGFGAGVWPIASMSAFALYLVPLAALAALISLALARRRCAAVLAVCAVALGFTVAARATPNDQPTAGGPQIRITSANLLRGRADPQALAEIVRHRNPDVLALQEFTPGTLAKFRKAGVLDDLPYIAHHKARNRTDTFIAARWPIQVVEVPDLPDVYTVGRLEIPASASAPARSVPIVSAHPTPPLRPTEQGRWERWLQALPGPGVQSPLGGGLVAGDFNATLDHRQFRDVLGLGWRDVADQLGEGLRPTWKGGSSMTPTRSLRLTIDHILIPPGAAARDYAIDPLPGSDHRAVTATVALPAGPAGLTTAGPQRAGINRSRS